MAVLPKKYDRGVRAEEYIPYMAERIEFYAQSNDKKTLELTKENAKLKQSNEALEKNLISLTQELAQIKQILINGGYYGNN
jgi:uncharacterized protein YceH (UPF0502 family)